MNLMQVSVIKSGDGINLRFSDELELALPPAKAQHLLNYAGKTIWFGIRPEHISLVNAGENNADSIVHGKVEIVEQMGNESYIHFNLNGVSLVARTAQLGNQTLQQSQDQVAFKFLLEHCHLFDLDTEQNIRLK
jgi:multiple sugar transport system ATP-binding protein